VNTTTHVEVGFYVTHKWLVAVDVWLGDANQKAALNGGDYQKPLPWGSHPGSSSLHLRTTDPMKIWANRYQIALFTLTNSTNTNYVPGESGFQDGAIDPEDQVGGSTNLLISLLYVPPRRYEAAPLVMVYGWTAGSDFATGTNYDMIVSGFEDGIALCKSRYYLKYSAGLTHLRYIQHTLLTHSGKPVMQNAWLRFAVSDADGQEALVRGKLWDALISSECPAAMDQFGGRYPARGTTMTFAEQRWLLAGGRVGVPNETQGGVWLRLGPVTADESLPV